MLRGFIVRDTSIVISALALWWLLAGHSAGGGALADFAGVVAGLGLGVCAYLLHEWGHYLGGLATRSRMTVSHNLKSGFMFQFDTRENSLAQFLVMSFSGFAATAAVLVAYFVFLPDGLLATRVARGSILLLAFIGLVLEFPLVLLSLRTRAVPTVAAVPVQREPA